MSKITLENLAFEGPELTDAELGDIAGGQMHVSWYIGGRPAEWVGSNG
ncbi:MAG: hypothetical protein JWQ95_6569 [Sphaerisporangium sp.]|jgi:putative ATP-grasp target RiPP|nr:hypothetical protein [Sphaerisporangium sp.]